jgi:prepilin-type N-terminal cleavage/methylation domain-containing protein
MKRRSRQAAGFTLLEIVVSLVLVGILAAIAGMGLVSGIKGYFFTRENAQLTQKAHLAMSRLTRELTGLIQVDTGNTGANYLVYQRPSGWYALAQIGDTLKIRPGTALPDATHGDILVDRLDPTNGLTFSYLQDATVLWDPLTDDVARLSLIGIDLEMTRQDSGIGTLRFTTTVRPRNNDNLGGAPLSAGKFSPWF